MPPISNEQYYLSVGYSVWGRWQVRQSPVSDPTKWTLIEDLGPALKAAYIEADGDFLAEAHNDHFSFYSTDTPWIAVITEEDKLYVKKLREPIGNSILLAENVSVACMCRTWRSLTWGVDTGLVVGYVTKSGAACIREYREVSGVRTWDAEQVIEASGAQNIKVIRLNDYRTGILCYPSSKLYVSERDYIGGTARTEYAYSDIYDDFLVFATELTTEPPDDVEITNVELYDLYTIKVTANYPFYSRDNNWADISCTSGNYVVDDFRIEDGFLWITLTQPVVGRMAYVRFRIRAFNRLRYERTANCRPIMPETDFALEPEPIPYTETAYSTITDSRLAFIDAVPRQDLTGGVTETIFTDVSDSALAVITESEMVDKSYDGPTESIIAAFSDSSLASITTTQSGILPV